jgi:predicted porin
MKKSLIAIAMLTAVGAASAQSSLNLYGVADVWVGKTKDGDMQLGSGGLAGSRIGFRGTEDLGGGLKASFNLEQAVNLTSGATDTPTFGRQANISLNGGFGTVKLGRSTTAFDDINGAANSGFDSDLSATAGTWVDYTGRANGQIYYASPELNGISGAVGFTLEGNQSSAAGTATNDITSLHVKYSSGPIYAGVAYQAESRNALTVGGSARPTVKHTLINGSYNLGIATIKASYRNVQNSNHAAAYDVFDSRKANEYQIGVDYPVNAQLTLSAGYASSELKGVDNRPGAVPTNGSIRNSENYGLAAGYTLSKRTTVYGGFKSGKTDGVSTSFVAAGVNHAF